MIPFHRCRYCCCSGRYFFTKLLNRKYPFFSLRIHIAKNRNLSCHRTNAKWKNDTKIRGFVSIKKTTIIILKSCIWLWIPPVDKWSEAGLTTDRWVNRWIKEDANVSVTLIAKNAKHTVPYPSFPISKQQRWWKINDITSKIIIASKTINDFFESASKYRSKNATTSSSTAFQQFKFFGIEQLVEKKKKWGKQTQELRRRRKKIFLVEFYQKFFPQNKNLLIIFSFAFFLCFLVFFTVPFFFHFFKDIYWCMKRKAKKNFVSKMQLTNHLDNCNHTSEIWG